MNENKEIELKKEDNKVIRVLKNIGIFLILLIGYLFVPQIVGIIIYNTLKISETLSLFIGNMTYVIILVSVFHNMFKEKIIDYKNNFSDHFGNSLKYWGIGLAIMFISNIILSYIVFPGEIAANEELNREYITGSPIIGFISAVLIAPFVEEMIFRFGIRKITGTSKYFPLITAIAFGLPHALTGMNTSLTISNLLQLLYVIPYGALGYAFGYIYNKTDNIFCSMTSHFLHNFMCYVAIIALI